MLGADALRPYGLAPAIGAALIGRAGDAAGATKEDPVSMVAELPTFQKTLHGDAPLMSWTREPLDAVNALPTLNMKTELGSPCPSRISRPDKSASDVKQ